MNFASASRPVLVPTMMVRDSKLETAKMVTAVFVKWVFHENMAGLVWVATLAGCALRGWSGYSVHHKMSGQGVFLRCMYVFYEGR